MRLELFQYSLPFIEPLMIGAELQTHREGLYLQADHLTRKVCAEVAPLPGFSSETITDARDELLAIIPVIESISTITSVEETLDYLQKQLQRKMLPSVAMGIESLLFDMLYPLQTPILVKLAHLAMSKTHINAHASSIKIKLAGLTPKQATQKIQVTLDAVSKECLLRVDCNRFFSFEEAVEIFSQFPLGSIDYIEEPTRHLQELIEFTNHVKHPVALDESLRDLPLQDLANISNVKALIIKPTLMGGWWYKLKELHTFFPSHQYRWVLTGSFESGVGIYQAVRALHVRGLLKHPAGIDTYRYLKKDNIVTRYEEKDSYLKVDIPTLLENGLMKIC